MARKNYTDEFRHQAVDLYRSTPGATLRGIAADLGISRYTLSAWVMALDPDTPSTMADSASGTVDGVARPGAAGGQRSGHAGPPEAELAALRAQVATLQTENAKLETERDILRQATKYFTGETNW